MTLGLVEPVIQYMVRSLCVRPYHNHPRGCPNYGRRPTCPPDAPRLEQIIDISAPVYCIYNRFDLATHVKGMQAKHPNWSERQLYCCLYWQPKARKELLEQIREFMHEIQGHGLQIVPTPEACGVNVTGTMRQINVELEWPPRTIAYQVVLAGTGLLKGEQR